MSYRMKRRNKKQKKVFNSEEVKEAFCICRDTSHGFMIACDDCDEWFHGECIGISEESAPEIYYCRYCTGKRVAAETHKQKQPEVTSPTQSLDIPPAPTPTIHSTPSEIVERFTPKNNEPETIEKSSKESPKIENSIDQTNTKEESTAPALKIKIKTSKDILSALEAPKIKIPITPAIIDQMKKSQNEEEEEPDILSNQDSENTYFSEGDWSSDDLKKSKKTVRKYKRRKEKGKVGRRGRKKQKKDPLRPKRAPPAYIFFANEHRNLMQRKYPELKFAEISRKLGDVWSGMTKEEKRKYEELAARESARYKSEKRNYIAPRKKLSQMSDESEEFEYVVSFIKDKRYTPEGMIEYLVHWDGYDSDQNTWESADNLVECTALIEDFEKQSNEEQKITVIGADSQPFEEKAVIDENLLHFLSSEFQFE